MANKTIYGCTNWPSGTITFEGEACDGGDYTGCIEWTGAHAGQVKVVINEYACDDTYYGCVNWTTGKFQLVIPDDCCRYGYDCDVCDEGKTPRQIQVTFSGLTICSPTDCSGAISCDCPESTPANYCNSKWVFDADPNQTFLLTQKGESDACEWIYTIENTHHLNTYVRHYPDEQDCQELCKSLDPHDWYIAVWVSASTMYVQMHNSGNHSNKAAGFYGTTGDFTCIASDNTINNANSYGSPCVTSFLHCYGGTALVENVI